MATVTVERELYRPLITGASLDGWLLYRIADGPYGRKPFDIGGFTKTGRGVGVEVKMVPELNTWDKFPWQLFAEHQVQWLAATSEQTGLSIVAIYEAKPQKMSLFFPTPSQCSKKAEVAVFQVKRLTLNPSKYNGKMVFRDWQTP